CQHRRVVRGQEVHLRACTGNVEALQGRGLRSRLHQRNHRRVGITVDAGYGRVAAGRRHVVAYLVAGHRRIQERRYLRPGAQKNAGSAGLTLMIVREDLLDRALPITPSVFNWKEQAAAESMLNTPATYAIYIAGLVFEWLQAEGGIAAIERRNIAKAQLIY